VSLCSIVYRCFDNATSHPRPRVSTGTAAMARVFQLDGCDAQLFSSWHPSTRDPLGWYVRQRAPSHAPSPVSTPLTLQRRDIRLVVTEMYLTILMKMWIQAATSTGQHKHTENADISMPRVGFESTIPVFDRAKIIRALVRRYLC
jgi:hypothetical protein